MFSALKQKKSTLMATLLQKEELRMPKLGELVQGPIIARKRSSVFVDLGSMGTGIIFGREFYKASDMLKHLAPGDSISAKVVGVDEEEGYVELSLKEAGDELLWGKLREFKESREPIMVTIIGANKGGLLAKIDELPAFLPASQLSSQHYPHVEGGDKNLVLQELQKLVGKSLKVQVLDIGPREQKLILSEKAAEQEVLKSLISHFKVGDIVEGEITGLVDFGAFMKIEVTQETVQGPSQEGTSQEYPQPHPMIEGLIHISELDWAIVEHPKEVVKVGERMHAKIIDISPEGRFSLSLKALKPDPWEEVEKTHKKGDVIRGTPVKFLPYGAFVKITPAIQGLVHISEFGTQKRMQEMLEIGKEYDFKILLIDRAQRRMSLGMIRDDTQEKQKGEIEIFEKLDLQSEPSPDS